MDFDFNSMTAGALAVISSIWAGYNDFSNKPKWMKILMIVAPVFCLGLVFSAVN